MMPYVKSQVSVHFVFVCENKGIPWISWLEVGRLEGSLWTPSLDMDICKARSGCQKTCKERSKIDSNFTFLF